MNRYNVRHDAAVFKLNLEMCRGNWSAAMLILNKAHYQLLDSNDDDNFD